MRRPVNKLYQDPLDIIWLRAANQCGIQILRDSNVFASWDGNAVLRIGTPDTLDSDDCLAQMILHELCHALVAGPEAFNHEDWGLDYDRPQDRVFEHATLRLQAALADPYRLRSLFASTTDFRDYFDRLPDDPLAEDGDPATQLANESMQRFRAGPWYVTIEDALLRTAVIANTVSEISDADSLWRRD